MSDREAVNCMRDRKAVNPPLLVLVTSSGGLVSGQRGFPSFPPFGNFPTRGAVDARDIRAHNPTILPAVVASRSTVLSGTCPAAGDVVLIAKEKRTHYGC
jgi:hypothetical protein